MPRSKGQFRGRSDREQVIDWLKADLRYYQNNIGETTEFGTINKKNREIKWKMHCHMMRQQKMQY